MATATYTPLATTTLGSTAATVTFSSISSSYTDLVLVINSGSTNYTDDYIRFNSDTGNSYSYGRFSGVLGNTAGYGRGGPESTLYFGSATTTVQGHHIVHILNYANTTTYKTIVARNGYLGTQEGTQFFVGSWRSTSAINRIDLSLSSTTWMTNSTFTLYGILCA